MLPPRTLTRQQFGATAAARKGGTFGNYLRYLATHRAQRLAARADDPFAPTDPAVLAGQIATQTRPYVPLNPLQLQRTIKGATAGFAATPQPVLQGQIQRNVSAQTDPIIRQITAAINQRAQSGSQAISGYTNRLAQNLMAEAPQVGAAYGRAQQSTAATEAALAQRLSGQGEQLSSELAQKLAAIQAPGAQVDQVAGGASRMATGAANAGFAKGSSALSELLSRGAGAEATAARMPGIARLGGLQGLRQLQAQSNANLNEQVGEVRSQVPGMVQELLNASRDRELTKAGQRRGIVEGIETRELGKAERRQTIIEAIQGRELEKAKTAETFGITRQELGLSRNQQRFDQQRTRETLDLTRQELGLSKQAQAFNQNVTLAQLQQRSQAASADLQDAQADRQAAMQLAAQKRADAREAVAAKFAQSQQSAADKRQFEAGQARADRAFEANQNRIDRQVKAKQKALDRANALKVAKARKGKGKGGGGSAPPKLVP